MSSPVPTDITTPTETAAFMATAASPPTAAPSTTSTTFSPSTTRTPTAALAHALNPDTFTVHFPPSTTYTLTSTMLHSDTPNIFSALFSANSGFHETSTRSITISDRSPELFGFICDYLRGYAIFPLREEAVPARWLPLAKMYDNLRRDAGYYGLVRLEEECRRWVRRELFPEDEQAVLKLDFSPYKIGMAGTAEVMVECHVADAPLLRRRFLEFRRGSGRQPLTYGPFPWKHVMDTIRKPEDYEGIIQVDGSAMIDAPPVFVKPPRTASLDIADRKYECARMLLTPGVTTHLLDLGVKQNTFVNCPQLRIHATDVTVRFRLSNPPVCTFIFADRGAAEGLASLQWLMCRGGTKRTSIKDEWEIGVDDGFAIDIDGQRVLWTNLVCWAAKMRERRLGSFNEGMNDRDILCDQLFSGSIDPETNTNMVPICYLEHPLDRFVCGRELMFRL